MVAGRSPQSSHGSGGGAAAVVAGSGGSGLATPPARCVDRPHWLVCPSVNKLALLNEQVAPAQGLRSLSLQLAAAHGVVL